MTRTIRLLLSGLVVVLCGYVLAISLGVAACATSGSGTGDVRTEREP